MHVAGQRGVTDEAGRVVFANLLPDEYSVDVRDPDFVWSTVPVMLRPREERTLVFVEPPGWTARATLLDTQGRPVPFAPVEIDTWAPVAYLRVEGGTQDLALYTDQNGRIWLPDMHHTTVNLTFRYGSRVARAWWLNEKEPYAEARLGAPE